MSHRCEGAGSSDLYFNVVQQGCGLPRGVFEGDGPTWCFRRPAQSGLLRDGVDLCNAAVDFVGQGFALAVPLMDEREQNMGRPPAPWTIWQKEEVRRVPVLRSGVRKSDAA